MEEYMEYKDKISLIFKSKSIKIAMNRFDKLNKIWWNAWDNPKFMRKLSKKLEITLNHTKKQENSKYQQFSRIIVQSNFPWKN